MSDWYDIHGNPASPYRDRSAGSEWDSVRRETKTGDATISTVHLGLDHRFGEGPPLIFETMVFGGGLDQECDRYSTIEQAHAGHERMVDRVRVEADAFAAMMRNVELRDALHVVESWRTAHCDAFDTEDYDGRSYRRMVDALKPTAVDEANGTERGERP